LFRSRKGRELGTLNPGYMSIPSLPVEQRL